MMSKRGIIAEVLLGDGDNGGNSNNIDISTTT